MINVKGYGAIGNGITDDTSLFKKHLNRVARFTFPKEITELQNAFS